MIRNGLVAAARSAPGSQSVLRALRPARPSRRCEDRSGWADDGGLAGAAVPRRPRDPLRGGSIALELPSFDDG